MSNKEKVKLTSRDNVKTFTLENFEKEYFNQNFNKYTFNIEEFNSLPLQFYKRKIQDNYIFTGRNMWNLL